MTNARVPLLVLVVLSAFFPVTTQAARTDSLMVTNTNDSGPGSLRQAIIEANNQAGQDLIHFDIPFSDPGFGDNNAWRIKLASSLPTLTGDSTTIDGSTQLDTNPYGPDVWIDGSGPPATAWVFAVESNHNQIMGLTITGAGSAGIKLLGGAWGNVVSDNYIGIDPWGISSMGNSTGVEIHGGAHDNLVADNTISGNTQDGVLVAGSDTDGNLFRGNLIGLSASGVTTVPNGRHGVLIQDGPEDTWVGHHRGNYISGNADHGVLITGSDTMSNTVTLNHIGTDYAGSVALGNVGPGVAIAAGSAGNTLLDNVISGNHQHGVLITGAGTDGNRLYANIIGADAQGTQPIPNGWHGVALYDGARSNWIGSFDGSDGNVIAASSWTGLAILNSHENYVLGNAIGTNRVGAKNLGNAYWGIYVAGLNNTIGYGSTIAHNGLDGIQVDGADYLSIGNEIRWVSIHSNGGKGIELVNGGNEELDAPDITLADCHHVVGTLPMCIGCSVQVFSDRADEGRVRLGLATTGATEFVWVGKVIGPNVTATVTDDDDNTSEFSAPWIGACHHTLLPLVRR